MNWIRNKNRDSNFVHINLNAWVTVTLNTWVTWKKMKEKRKDSVGKVSLPVTWHHPWKCFDIVKTGLRKHYHLVAGDFLEQPNYKNSSLHFSSMFVIHESIFFKATLRSLSNNSNISFILGLATFDWIFHPVWDFFFWFLEW